MHGWPATLRGRLTLWYTLVIGVPFLLFELVGYLFFAAALRAGTERYIDDALAAFTHEMQAERFVRGDPRATIVATVAEVRFRDLHVEVRDDAGQLIAASAAPVPADGGRVLTRSVVLEGKRYALTGTYPRHDEEEELVRIRTAILLAAPLLLLLAAAGGQQLAKRGLRPVAAMGTRAAEISATTLHERLPVTGGEELIGLARVVNALLDRLQESFERQRRFVADASHELRTPTAIVRAEAEVTLARPHREEPEYRAALSVVHDASLRLTRLVDDLFLLARADAGHLQLRRQPMFLEDVVLETVRGVRPLAAQREIEIELGALMHAPMRGDPDHVGRVLLNLLDNAIKYAPAASVVAVAMDVPAPGFCRVRVTDAGPGIPAEDHARIFERFVRVETARDAAPGGGPSGAGLGLAIARRILELHGGSLRLEESRPGATTFAVELPLDEEESPEVG